MENASKTLIIIGGVIISILIINLIVFNFNKISTLKKVEFVKGEDWLRLVPINPNVPPILIEGEDLEHCRVMGVPKLLIREM